MGALDWTGLGVGLLQSGINHVINSNNMDKQFRYQKDLMRMQNDFNVQNWHMQNSYNTPAAQMQRLKAAGLNPDLMYGNGAAGIQAPLPSPVSGGSAPGYAPAPEGLNLASDIQAIANAKKAGAETVAQNIENTYLANKFYLENLNLAKDLKTKDKSMEVSDATIKHLSQVDAQIVQDIDAVKVRLGYEKFDRVVSWLNTNIEAAFKRANIEDMEATRTARIFQAMASGRMADANAAIIGMFRDPKKLEKWVTDIKKVIFGDGNEGSGLVGQIATDLGLSKKESPYVRRFFMWLDSIVNGDVPYDIRNK